MQSYLLVQREKLAHLCEIQVYAFIIYRCTYEQWLLSGHDILVFG